MTFYPADLARIHDEGFGDFGRAAAAELLTRLPGSGLVVELGCGSGITSQILSDAGYDVLGIDISDDMLAIARTRAPRARFERRSAWDAELPPCTAITAIGEVLNYTADGRAGAGAIPALFARIHAALEPGGLFMFDFATPGRGSKQTVHEGADWQVAVETVEDVETQTLQRRMEINGRIETHTLELYQPDFIQKCLEGPGFVSEALDRYSDFGFWPGYAAFAAVKSG